MKRITFVFVCFWLLAALPLSASANMAAPGPELILIVIGGPDDLSIEAVQSDGVNEGRIQLRGASVGYEKHFVWPFMEPWTTPPAEELSPPVDTTLRVRGAGVEWDVPLDVSKLKTFSNLMTLDVKNRTVRLGQPPWRQPLLIGIRVALTLLAEGVVFSLFGYRAKKSWAVFIVTNLATQTFLNILMAQTVFWAYALAMLVYFVGEPLIFLAEALVFILALREKSGKRGAVCAIAANAASLLLGLLLFAFIPI